MPMFLFNIYIDYTKLALGNTICLFESSQTVCTIDGRLEYEQKKGKLKGELHQQQGIVSQLR